MKPETCEQNSQDMPQKPNGSHLLALPLELRREIYSYILPTAVPVDNPHLRYWRRGETSLLSVNKQFHDEAADFIYGGRLFEIGVFTNTNHVHFDLQIQDLNGRAYRDCTYDDCGRAGTITVDQVDIAYMQRLKIVLHWEGYGWTKRRQSAQRVLSGVREQIETLCAKLRAIPRISALEVVVRDTRRVRGTKKIPGYTEAMLEPFRALRNVEVLSFRERKWPKDLEKTLERQELARVMFDRYSE